MEYEAVLNLALKLSPHERERLSLRLSLMDDPAAHGEAPVSPAQAAVLRERIAGYEADPQNVIPAGASLRQARQSLSEHRELRSQKSKTA